MRIPTDPKTPASAVRFFQIDTEQAGQRVDNFLIRVCKGVPKSHLYKAIRGGEVRVNKGRVQADYRLAAGDAVRVPPLRSEEHTSELQSLMRISYAVFCLQKKNQKHYITTL